MRRMMTLALAVLIALGMLAGPALAEGGEYEVAITSPSAAQLTNFDDDQFTLALDLTVDGEPAEGEHDVFVRVIDYLDGDPGSPTDALAGDDTVGFDGGAGTLTIANPGVEFDGPGFNVGFLGFVPDINDIDEIQVGVPGDPQEGEADATDAVSVLDAPDDPDARDACRQGGYADFGFDNQGRCMQYVNTGKDSR